MYAGNFKDFNHHSAEFSKLTFFKKNIGNTIRMWNRLDVDQGDVSSGFFWVETGFKDYLQKMKVVTSSKELNKTQIAVEVFIHKVLVKTVGFFC